MDFKHIFSCFWSWFKENGSCYVTNWSTCTFHSLCRDRSLEIKRSMLKGREANVASIFFLVSSYLLSEGVTVCLRTMVRDAEQARVTRSISACALAGGTILVRDDGRSGFSCSGYCVLSLKASLILEFANTITNWWKSVSNGLKRASSSVYCSYANIHIADKYLSGTLPEPGVPGKRASLAR